jgi:hypothetical protein
VFQVIDWKGVHWIYLAQDRDKWRAYVKMVMKLRGSIKCGEFYQLRNH